MGELRAVKALAFRAALPPPALALLCVCVEEDREAEQLPSRQLPRGTAARGARSLHLLFFR